MKFTKSLVLHWYENGFSKIVVPTLYCAYGLLCTKCACSALRVRACAKRVSCVCRVPVLFALYDIPSSFSTTLHHVPTHGIPSMKTLSVRSQLTPRLIAPRFLAPALEFHSTSVAPLDVDRAAVLWMSGAFVALAPQIHTQACACACHKRSSARSIWEAEVVRRCSGLRCMAGQGRRSHFFGE